MKIGLKTLLFGAHQFIYHPILVYLAWTELFGKPDFKECICILIHDLGYWNCKTIEGIDGENHSELGAKIAYWLFGSRYRELVLYHSRTYAAKDNITPSKLCYADKYSVKFENWYFYLLRTKFTGELTEYRRKFYTIGSDKFWFYESRAKTINFALDYMRFCHV